MAGAKTHQYHIVNPSIWPLIGAISALTFFSGMVRWMHSLPYGGYIIGAGVIGIAATMFSWWSTWCAKPMAATIPRSSSSTCATA